MASNLNLPPIPPKLKPIAHLLKTATGKIPTFRNVSELLLGTYSIKYNFIK